MECFPTIKEFYSALAPIRQDRRIEIKNIKENNMRMNGSEQNIRRLPFKSGTNCRRLSLDVDFETFDYD